jgi:hypothetical protein
MRKFIGSSLTGMVRKPSHCNQNAPESPTIKRGVNMKSFVMSASWWKKNASYELRHERLVMTT